MFRRNYPVWRRYLTVEVVIFFYGYGVFAGYLLIQQYVYSVVSEEKGFPYKELVMDKDGPGCHGNMTGLNSTLKQLEKEVQSVATKIDLGNTFFKAIPALFVAPFWGPWTDKSGRRKPALIAPVIGAVLECTVMLIVMYFKLPLYTLFVGSAISGFSGFLTTIAIAVMSYIADTTEKTGRAFRIAIIQMLIFMSGVLSQLTSGLWIEKFGFIAPTWFVLVCYIASGLWAIFLVPENQERDKHAKNKFFDSKNLKMLVNVFKQPRPDGARKSLLLLVIAGTILALTIEGLQGVTTLFLMRSPLCFGPKLVGYFLAYGMFIAGLGGAIGVKLFGNFFNEKIVGAIGLISQIVEMAVLAFANRTWFVFLAPALGFFGGSAGPLMVGIVSRMVGVDEQGSLFCAVGITSVLSQFLGAMLFNNVYEATLGLEFNGFVFLLSAALTLIPFGILSCVHVSPPTEQRVETDEEMRLDESDKENVTGQDDALIKKGNDGNDNEDGKDETELETLAIPEDNELVKTTKS